MKDQILSGGCSDIKEYADMSGFVRGVDRAAVILIDIVKRVEADQLGREEKR